MTQSQRLLLALSRCTMGFMMLYAGITKIIDPQWSALGYLKGAKAMVWFYTLLQHPSMLPVIDFVNAWGLTLLGVSLILGIGVRIAAPFGALLMVLYYIPLGFPYPNPHALIVDEHLIYATVLLYFAAVNAGAYWGLSDVLKRTAIGKIPVVGKVV